MTTKFDKELEQLSNDDYQALIEEGKDIASKLASGEIFVQRELTYLRSIKAGLIKCVKTGLSYSDIARAFNRVNKQFKFKPAQIKKVCEEGKKIRKPRSTQNQSNANNITNNVPNSSQQNSTVDTSSNVIEHTHSNISEAEDL